MKHCPLHQHCLSHGFPRHPRCQTGSGCGGWSIFSIRVTRRSTISGCERSTGSASPSLTSYSRNRVGRIEGGAHGYQKTCRCHKKCLKECLCYCKCLNCITRSRNANTARKRPTRRRVPVIQGKPGLPGHHQEKAADTSVGNTVLTPELWLTHCFARLQWRQN